MAEEIDLKSAIFGNCRNYRSHVTLTFTLDRVKVTLAYTVHVGLPAPPTVWLASKRYGNMAVWKSCNIDIPQSLNSRDSFLRRKFKNSGPTSYTLGLVLSLSAISFELYVKMAEEIKLEKCNFRNFESPVTLTLTLDRVEVTLMHISGRVLSRDQITFKSENFVDVRTYGRTDGHTWVQ